MDLVWGRWDGSGYKPRLALGLALGLAPSVLFKIYFGSVTNPTFANPNRCAIPKTLLTFP